VGLWSIGAGGGSDMGNDEQWPRRSRGGHGFRRRKVGVRWSSVVVRKLLSEHAQARRRSSRARIVNPISISGCALVEGFALQLQLLQWQGERSKRERKNGFEEG
jgi:hypothetical protein